ncbi:7TM diverse intracellular signaling [Leptospira interrogans serovar Manilae]|uniref:7TM diverse intracellular signaling n=1 Tax=Leptospira interrogans serovar Manilae TaxID=214675 RepID=A0AAQ1SQI9_LEPIR|nr:7TM diverse intracellular signaling domain-containing protein [Leptospira interrogans]AKP24753.1 transcriptional regulator [Leptospira interrogans serovar Manilae]AKP28538.1 transcriptional regulator [Leptospira interrogans serovar Manilae]EYU62271.1 transcriptional regulator [Leptospira interrogans serovar Manilae]SOR63433.1 7TM diverse intracellular signaling [Leptospira interrogans serovar Manilae]
MFFFFMKFQQTFINCFLFLILFLSFVLSKEIHSSPVAEICEFDQIEFALDPDLSNEVPKEPKKSLVFLPKENSFLKLGFIKESVWIRFNIKQYPRSRCFLRIPQVTLDGAALFAKSSVQITGDRFRYSERFVDDYYPVFYLEPLDIQKEKNQYYLWIKTSSIINFPIFLESGLEYQKGNYYRNLLILFLLVLSLFIILLIGFIYRQTLDPVYLSIMGFLVFITLEGWVCFANGYKYLWPNVPQFQNITPTLFAFFALACSVCFMVQFLSPSALHKIFRFLLFGTVIVIVCLAILSSFVLDRALVVKIFSWTFIFVSVLVLISTFSIIKSFSPARKIILCMIPIIGSGLITILYYLDLLKYNEYYVHAYLLSLPSIYIVITVSLRDREKFVKRKFLSRAYDIRQMQEKLNLPVQVVGQNKTPSLQFSLDHLLRVERIFKNPELSKKDFAEILRITPNDLDRFVQEFSNLQSFEIYINLYRVEEAKHLLKTRKDLKSSEIAHRSGFVSGREMEKSFKTLTGMTSSEYKLMLFPDSI